MEHAQASADLIRAMAWHTYDNYEFAINFDNPHSEDCQGCVINAEVDRLMAALENERIKRGPLEQDRERSFIKAGLVEEGLVSDLVVMLMESNDRLRNQIRVFKDDINAIARQL